METGIFTLLGMLVGGLLTFAVQLWAQRMENFRHRQKLAYEIAAKEWEFWAKYRLDVATKSGAIAEIPSVVDFIAANMRISELLNRRDFSKMTDAAVARAFEQISARNDAVAAYFTQELARRSRKTEE